MNKSAEENHPARAQVEDNDEVSLGILLRLDQATVVDEKLRVCLLIK